MSNSSGAIKGDYRTHKHIPSRTCYQLIIEVAEEAFPEVCRTLGYPKTGENTYVAIALLDKEVTEKQPWFAPTPEGDKLRVRSVLLCKSTIFHHYLEEITGNYQPAHLQEETATNYIYSQCGIKSRSEIPTNLAAQEKLKELLSKYETWKLSKTYEDNLNR